MTQQLRELEAEGLIYRESYPESPPRVEYALTPQGQTFTPIVESMSVWGKAHKPDYPFGYCRLENLRVLIVSPDASSISAILEIYLTNIIAATDFEAAFHSLSQAELDIVLMDLALLNDVNAPSFVTQIQQIEKTQQKNLAIVAILPHNNAIERGRAFRLGFPVHLPKPIESTEMGSTIASLTAQVVE